MLAQVGDVLLPQDHAPGAGLGPLLKVEAAWINALPAVAVALAEPMQALERLLGRAVGIDLAPEGLDAAL